MPELNLLNAALRLVPDPPADSLGEAVVPFTAHLVADGRSPLTVSAYRRDLATIGRVLAGRFPGVAIDVLTPAMIDGALSDPAVTAMEDGAPRAPATVHRLKAALLSFFTWAEETGRVARSPARFVKLRRLPRTPPEYLTDAEVRRVRKELAGRASPRDRRDRVIIELFLWTGVRLQELVSLNLEDVDLDGKHLRVRRAKGGVAQIKFLRSDLRSLLRGYIRERQRMPAVEDALFISDRERRISPRQVENRVRYWIGRAGVAKNVGPHGLRHSFATRLYSTTSSLLVVQRALGHKDVSTTQVYTHLSDSELEDAIERA